MVTRAMGIMDVLQRSSHAHWFTTRRQSFEVFSCSESWEQLITANCSASLKQKRGTGYFHWTFFAMGAIFRKMCIPSNFCLLFNWSRLANNIESFCQKNSNWTLSNKPPSLKWRVKCYSKWEQASSQQFCHFWCQKKKEAIRTKLSGNTISYLKPKSSLDRKKSPDEKPS